MPNGKMVEAIACDHLDHSAHRTWHIRCKNREVRIHHLGLAWQYKSRDAGDEEQQRVRQMVQEVLKPCSETLVEVHIVSNLPSSLRFSSRTFASADKERALDGMSSESATVISKKPNVQKGGGDILKSQKAKG